MMRLVRRALLLALSLLTSTATAYAWVLWEDMTQSRAEGESELDSFLMEPERVLSI